LSKQERGKELAALVVPSYRYPCIFVLLRALRDSLLFVTTTSNKSSRFNIAKQKTLSDPNARFQRNLFYIASPFCSSQSCKTLPLSVIASDQRERGNPEELLKR
jgi:hypothetical protein